ncbi:MAG: CobW family GTP-binding protein [Methylococcaceae bacterium]|jgi:G3E family GTPase
MKLTPREMQRIPVFVLSGFLGSGKTTLLNHILGQMPRTAVIINEFGTTPIDQQLLREHNIPLVTLAGGCLCCQVRDAIAPILKNLRIAWEQADEKPFDRIIIETSGVANPEPVLDILLGKNWLSTRYHLQGVIATISALHGLDNLSRFPEAKAQIAWADTVAISHTDLAEMAQIHVLERHLKNLSPAAKQVYVVNGKVDLGQLMPQTLKFRRLRTEMLEDIPMHDFYSVSLKLEPAITMQCLDTVLRNIMSKYSDSLVRLKGLIFNPGYDHPLLIQGSAGILYPPTALPPRASDDFISRLVFIMVGPVDGLAEEVMQQLRWSADVNNAGDIVHRLP